MGRLHMISVHEPPPDRSDLPEGSELFDLCQDGRNVLSSEPPLPTVRSGQARKCKGDIGSAKQGGLMGYVEGRAAAEKLELAELVAGLFDEGGFGTVWPSRK
jgi:hypothetical protein